ncbi:SWIM-type domain-containing protein [Aphis craccivora]|uniref:SWIM-type domain-containing protein n=1 Tax=Aphis craccivora TaxID=307492 RepID=A0A6G0VK08_APHCR|nr:SWIM-type domain-containing protein [Aphis craccivora]
MVTQFPTHGHNTNNIVEASIRVFKDIVLERCKAFNSAALVDFICKILEDYHKRRLIKFSSFPGQGGGFCKHICAVHLFGDTVNNLPNLTNNDRIEIGT